MLLVVAADSGCTFSGLVSSAGAIGTLTLSENDALCFRGSQRRFTVGFDAGHWMFQRGSVKLALVCAVLPRSVVVHLLQC